MDITAAQLRAGRAMLSLSRTVVAKRAGVSLSTLNRLENAAGALPGLHTTISAVTAVLEADGVVFAPNNSVALHSASLATR